MKTKKLFFALLVALGGALAANAQITTGEPTSKIIRTGNRAEKGDFGLYIGATTSMFGNIFKEDVQMVPLPLLNLKYMATDKFELRVGLEAYKLSEKLN
jgi:HAMP domain-containing protein